MKKILFSAAVFTALFATSCQKGSDVVALPEEANVTFMIETPEIATRAFGDGTSANDLYYGIYDAEGNLIEAISKIDDNNKETINISKAVNLRLVTGNTYSMIFWADNANDVCDVDFASKTMSFNPAEANQEAYDAFWAYVEPFVVESNMSKSVQLYRPFAQLNIGTDDVEDAQAAGLVVSESAVSVTTPSALDLVTGEVSEEVTVTYDFAAIPEGEAFPVANYDYLSMNYLLVGAEKSTVDVAFTYTDGQAEYDRNYTFVPVQRNYRTNIFGSILTSAVDVNVVIEPTFNEPDYNVYGAFQTGGTVTLQENLVIDEPLVVKAGVNTVLNLNGKTITNQLNNAQTDVILVEEGATLTINGEGTIEAITGNDGFTIITDGTLIINGGTFKSGVDANGEANAVIYVRGNGKAYVNGGTFPNDNTSKYVLNKKDADRKTTVIEVKGGEFHNFDPANNTAEGTGTNFMAPGYTTSANGTVYTVVAPTTVTTEAALTAALAAGEAVELADDIQLEQAFVLDSEATILLNGKTITGGVFAESSGTMTEGNSDSYAFWVKAGGVLNLYGDGNVAAQRAKYSMAIWADGGEVNIYGGNYTNDFASDLIYAKNDGVVNIYGGTFKASNYNKENEDGTNEEYSALNLHDKYPGVITVYGGSFYKFNPADNLSENPKVNFVATGYKSVQNGDWWVVEAE